MECKIYKEYDEERIAGALSKCWLFEDVWGDWWLGMGTRGVGRGWRVPNKSAKAAIKRDDVARHDTGLGVIYVARDRVDAPPLTTEGLKWPA